jgi:hypothetical protein
MHRCSSENADCPATAPKPSEFDTLALKRRAEQWRIEAARVATDDMRAFCQREAEQCERRLRVSFDTPVIRERNEDSKPNA